MQQEKLSVAMSVSPQRIYANLIKSFFGGLWRTTAEFSQQQCLFHHFSQEEQSVFLLGGWEPSSSA